MPKSPSRCSWPQNDLSIRYHDDEWGVPSHDDRHLFEFLILEGAQAGLSWDTILQKRENYRAALDGFNPERIASYNKRKQQSLLKNPGIVRNRLKIASMVQNARAFLDCAIRCHEQRPEEARVQFCWVNDLLCPCKRWAW